MKVIFAIVLLGLVSSSLAFYNVKKLPSTIIDTSFLKNANTPKKHTFAGLTNLMQQLRDTSAVQQFLDGLLEELANVRQQKLAIIEQTRADCAEEEAFREQAVTEGERSAAAAQGQLNLCNAQKDQALHLQELAASALEVYENDLEELNAARDEQVKTYETRVAKLEDARAAIADLQALIDEFEAEANSPLDSALFIQTSNKLLRHSVATGHSHLVLPVFTKLLQLHAKQSVSANDLESIRQALNTLDENAANTVNGLIEQEAQDQQNYDAAKSRLEGLIARLSNQVSVTQAFVGTMEQCIAQEESLLALSNDKVDRNAALLEVAGRLCSASEDEWRLSELNRVREIGFINNVKSGIELFETDYEAERGPKVGDIIELRML